MKQRTRRKEKKEESKKDQPAPGGEEAEAGGVYQNVFMKLVQLKRGRIFRTCIFA